MKNLLKELRNENNKLEKNLSKENGDILTGIIVYIKCKKICEIDVEIIRKDLLGMALESELRDESLNSLIGDDYKSFSESLIRNCDKDSLFKKILSLSFIITMSILSIFFFRFVSYVISNKSFTVSLSLDFIISSLIGVLFVFFMFKFMSKNAFNITKKLFISCSIINVILTSIFVLTILLLRNIFIVNVNFLFFLVLLIIISASIYIIDVFYTNKIFESKFNKLGDI